VSLQPNSGAQGELAGLLVIQAWHRGRGEKHRDIALIPQSAHGTNPASAAMAGMQVVVVACDDKGNIDVVDLEKKARQHADKLAALLVTYPSTHGVFEDAIQDICHIVHTHGGQVYMDGANMNAQVGLTSPGHIGADVCHLLPHDPPDLVLQWLAPLRDVFPQGLIDERLVVRAARCICLFAEPLEEILVKASGDPGLPRRGLDDRAALATSEVEFTHGLLSYCPRSEGVAFRAEMIRSRFEQAFSRSHSKHMYNDMHYRTPTQRNGADGATTQTQYEP
jgi:hypothetical protein